MVKLTPLPEVGYEAELLNLDVPSTVRLSEGATEAEAIENLCQQVAQYSLELQAIDYMQIARP
jgi:hypothetical protein